MSLKQVDGKNINNQKEICLVMGASDESLSQSHKTVGAIHELFLQKNRDLNTNANHGLPLQQIYSQACDFLALLGCARKAYQETKREIWMLEDVEICIDEWLFLEPFVEVEGKSEEVVKEVSEKLGFGYKKVYFGSVDGLYEKKHGISKDDINDKIEEIRFDIKNPFINN